MPEGITLKPVRDHIEVFFWNDFIFSTDDQWEAEKELESITADKNIYRGV